MCVTLRIPLYVVMCKIEEMILIGQGNQAEQYHLLQVHHQTIPMELQEVRI